MENINTGRGARVILALLPVVPALIATLGGRPVALPYNTLIDVLVDGGYTGAGRVRYVAADGTVAVHFGCDPINHVWEFPADRVRGIGISHQMRLSALRAYLATNPPVSCDLDASDVSEPLRVERAS